MTKRLTIVSEECAGGHICELACVVKPLGANGPKKSVLRYTHMREVEYVEEGEPKRLRYADIEAGGLRED